MRSLYETLCTIPCTPRLWHYVFELEVDLMSTAREEIARLVQAQPADSSREETVRELAFHVMVEKGLVDSDARRVISNSDMAHRIRSWRK